MMSMAEAKKALKLAKSSFTRKQNGIARIIAMASDHPSKTAVDQLASSRKDFQMAYEEVMNKLNEIALLAEDDASEEGYIKSMEEIQQRYEDTLAEILAASTDIKPELPAAPSPSADQGAARANMALRPILSLQFSPSRDERRMAAPVSVHITTAVDFINAQFHFNRSTFVHA